MKYGNLRLGLPSRGRDMVRIIKRTAASRFARNVLILTSGTALAQAISVAFVPLLSRLYSPSAFGVYGVYVSLVGVVGAVASLRYDLALMLPKREEDAANLLGVCSVSVTAVAVLSAIVCFVFGAEIVSLLKTPELLPWLWLVPISIFLWGIYQTMNSWSTRRKQFHRASISQVARASTAPGIQAAIAIQHVGPFGLMVGAIAGDFCATLVLLAQLVMGDRNLVSGSVSLRQMRALAKDYADFPCYAAPQTLLNTLSQYLPLMLLAHFFGAAVVGYYSVGMRMIQLPMNIIMTSLRQVLFQRVSEVYNSGGDTYAFFRKTTLGLVALVAVPVLAIIIFAPLVASFVLGAPWHAAGEYARWLVMWLGLMFCNIPAVLFAQLYRRQRALLMVDIILLICRAAAIIVGGLYLSALGAVVLYSVVGVAFNLFLILWMWDYLRQQRFRLPAEESVELA